MTLIFLSPALFRTSVNSVLTSSALASAAGAAPAAMGIGRGGADAVSGLEFLDVVREIEDRQAVQVGEKFFLGEFCHVTVSFP